MKDLFILSKQMFEVSPFSSHKRTAVHAAGQLPRRWHAAAVTPCNSQTSLQISNSKYGPAVDVLLRDAPDFIVIWNQVGTILWLQACSSEVRCCVCLMLYYMAQKSLLKVQYEHKNIEM